MPQANANQANQVFGPGARARGQLRPIAGGSDPFRLPIYVPTLPDETFSSWLCRLSYRYGLSTRGLLAGIDIPIVRTAGILGSIVSENAKFLRLTGVDSNSFGRDPTERKGISAFCPRCLESDGFWRQSWGNGSDFLCLQHNCWLQTICPSCGTSPWQSTAWLGVHFLPTICPERLPFPGKDRRVGQQCEARLASGAIVFAPRDTIEAQQFLVDIRQKSHSLLSLSDGRLKIDLDQAIEAYDHLARLAEESSSRLPGELHNRYRARITVAAVANFRALGSDDKSGTCTISLLPSSHRDSPLRRIGDDPNHLGPVLTAVAVAAERQHLSPVATLSWRLGRRWPSLGSSPKNPNEHRALPEHHSVPLRPPVEWIPQVLWPSVSQDMFDTADVTGRAVLSMCLAHLGRHTKWSLLALELGLPANLQQSASSRLKRLRASGSWYNTLAALEDLFGALQGESPPVNYRARRIIASDVSEISTALSIGTGPSPSNRER